MDKIEAVGPTGPGESNGKQITILPAEQLKRLAARSDRISKRILRKAICQVLAWTGDGARPS